MSLKIIKNVAIHEPLRGMKMLNTPSASSRVHGRSEFQHPSAVKIKRFPPLKSLKLGTSRTCCFARNHSRSLIARGPARNKRDLSRLSFSGSRFREHRSEWTRVEHDPDVRDLLALDLPLVRQRALLQTLQPTAGHQTR